MKHGYIYFGGLGLAGLIGLYVVLGLHGIEGWLVFGLLVWSLMGLGGCWALAREARGYQKGYDKWRATVHLVQHMVNEGDVSTRLAPLVTTLDDPVLKETYDSLCRARERDLERRQNGGDHSGR